MYWYTDLIMLIYVNHKVNVICNIVDFSTDSKCQVDFYISVSKEKSTA